MAAGVGVLGAKCRAEGVDLGEREAVGLDVELSRYGQERLAAEKVLAEVDLAGRRARQVGEIQRRDAEQRAGAFGIRRGDDRRVHPEEAVRVEIAVDRLRQRVPHPGRGANHIGARPQMRDLAEVLHGVRLRLDRVGVRVVDPADHPDGARLHLERLALALRRHDDAGRLDRAAGCDPQNLVVVIGQRVRRDHLKRMERRAVGQMHEGNAGLGVAPGAHPAFDRDGPIRRRLAGQNGVYVISRILHGRELS